MKLIYKIWDFFNPYSKMNLDNKIDFYKKCIIKDHKIPPKILFLEEDIENAGSRTKYKLKLELKHALKEILDDIQYEKTKRTL